jgi:general secretion pathway protein G
MGKVRPEGGFTLIEILIVVVIIALIATVVGTNVFDAFGRGQAGAARAQLEGFEQAIKLFKLDTGRLPTSAEGLEALVSPGPSNVRNYHSDGYLDEPEVPVDPWGNAYHYETDGRRFTVISFGPDGVSSDDDITNWTRPR